MVCNEFSGIMVINIIFIFIVFYDAHNSTFEFLIVGAINIVI